jgi:hypothetical protein
VRPLSLLSVFFAGAVLVACSGDDDTRERRAQPSTAEGPPAAGEAPAVGDAGPIHVHALGVNPADGALFVATHTGLFREPRPGMKPRRVADRWQDTMGFTVIGPDRFLASGHPDGREGLPPFLGLIESTDAGRSWTPVSLEGEMDFHVLEAAGRRIYGFGSDWEKRTERLLVSDDRGRSWDERPAPEPLIDLAVDPGDADRAVAAGRDGLHLTVDGGGSWRGLPGKPGLLDWTKGGLYSIDRDGVVRVARYNLQRFDPVGRVGGEPAALHAADSRRLYVALHDGSIKRSADGGISWHVEPPRKAAGGQRAERRAERRTVTPRARRSKQRRDAPTRERCEALQDMPGPASDCLARK